MSSYKYFVLEQQLHNVPVLFESSQIPRKILLLENAIYEVNDYMRARMCMQNILTCRIWRVVPAPIVITRISYGSIFRSFATLSICHFKVSELVCENVKIRNPEIGNPGNPESDGECTPEVISFNNNKENKEIRKSEIGNPEIRNRKSRKVGGNPETFDRPVRLLLGMTS